jgi:hypothetical protein
VTVTRHVPDHVRPLENHAVGSSTGMVSRTSSTRDGLAESSPPSSDYSDQVIVLGRLKPGRGWESRRVVHIFELASQVALDSTVTARCGEPVPVADVQVLPGLTGMPCEYCVQLSMVVGH